MALAKVFDSTFRNLGSLQRWRPVVFRNSSSAGIVFPTVLIRKPDVTGLRCHP